MKNERLNAHRAALQTSGAIRMTVEEILAGETQAGVPRPAFLSIHPDEATPLGSRNFYGSDVAEVADGAH